MSEAQTMADAELTGRGTCQKCGLVGGAVFSWSENRITWATWCCPRCVHRLMDEQSPLQKRIAVLEKALRHARAHCIGHSDDPFYLRWYEVLWLMDEVLGIPHLDCKHGWVAQTGGHMNDCAVCSQEEVTGK